MSRSVEFIPNSNTAIYAYFHEDAKVGEVDNNLRTVLVYRGPIVAFRGEEGYLHAQMMAEDGAIDDVPAHAFFVGEFPGHDRIHELLVKNMKIEASVLRIEYEFEVPIG
jgi:hypothetical protein